MPRILLRVRRTAENPTRDKVTLAHPYVALASCPAAFAPCGMHTRRPLFASAAREKCLLAVARCQSHDNGSRKLPWAALCRGMPALGVLETLLIWTRSGRSSASDSGVWYDGLLSMIHLPRLLSARAKRLDSCLLERH